MNKISQAQKHLKSLKIDGWLLYDFHKNNELAHQFLEISSGMTTRRFFYWIPKEGTPIKIVHAIEPHVLDRWPGEKRTYLSWQSLEKELKSVLSKSKRVAMEYSPKNAIPYVSKVDGGTIDLVRSFGVEVVSSADFLPFFTAVLDEEQKKSHLRAASALAKIADETWAWIGGLLKKGKEVSEYDIQQKIFGDFNRLGLVTDSLPIAAVGKNSADPHYAPKEKGSSVVREGDLVLIDLWATEKGARSIFGDITRVAVAARKPSKKQQEIFDIVRGAQKAAVQLVKSRFLEGKRLEGWEVDKAARDVIEKAGYGKFFIHRTGHSIEMSLHGSGAHMDNLEMHDERPLLLNTCFSIEPGIYLPGEFGVRLEHDVLISGDGTVEITGGDQDKIVCLWA
jgi:Xaa-Pro aminopeptidase